MAEIQEAALTPEQLDKSIADNQSRVQHAKLWQRMIALLIDIYLTELFILPLTMIDTASKLYSFIFNFLIVIFLAWFNIYFVKKYGATPGKLLMNIRVISFDSRNTLHVNYQKAFLRHSLYLFCNLLAISFSSNSSEKLFDSENPATLYTSILILLFFLTDTAFAIYHPQRRALHDIIAKTAVIDSSYDPKLMSTQQFIKKSAIRFLIFLAATSATTFCLYYFNI
jgi:hypothetical protein